VPITKILKNTKKELSILILAGGLSKKIKKNPKSLIEIDGEKLILRQIRILKSIYPYADFIVVLGYGAEEIRKILPPYIRCVENEVYDITNIAKAMSIGFKVCIAPTCLIVYGDLVFSKKTFSCIEDESCLILNKNARKDSIGVNIHDNKIEHLSFTSDEKWGQIIYANGNELKLLKEMAYSQNSKLLGSEIINLSIERGAKFKGIYTQGPLIELDTLQDIIKMNIMMEKL